LIDDQLCIKKPAISKRVILLADDVFVVRDRWLQLQVSVCRGE